MIGGWMGQWLMESYELKQNQPLWSWYIEVATLVTEQPGYLRVIFLGWIKLEIINYQMKL